MFSSKSEVVKVSPGSFCIQVPEVKEPLTDDKFLGPLSFFIRFTGLDCSIVALSKVDSRFKFRAWITQIFAVIVMAIIVLRCFTFFQLHGHSMSFQWAESGMFAFLGVQSVECAYCIFSWTRNDFMMNHLEKLEVLRLLRVKDNEKIDNYCSIHLKVLVWTGLWTLVTMAHAVNCAIEEKVILSGNRQAELIHLVRSANKSLGGYTFTTPISMFNACINAIYIFFSFREELPLISGVIMTLNIFATIFMTYFSIRPASNVQFHIQDTSRILMESREFENSKDADVMNTYHIMIDRSLRHTARLRVLGGIPIYPTTFHIAMFFIPSLGTLLSFVKKSLHTYGLEMHK
ncbi:hypothetical protein GCK72_018458 [Caenorhabditis remanei]|uniref:Uncharacterized protein n=1 Tax=Caenorhabditis remanei TaxID=31234 RepID=A0A6A5GB41_CAERE|nr:hypothetical protein GCK72_018458 [Caenorhabditis remanei]KAF1751904.1 hypothetical protein GCK72_018458 [Caenorhabditis remanei]